MRFLNNDNGFAVVVYLMRFYVPRNHYMAHLLISLNRHQKLMQRDYKYYTIDSAGCIVIIIKFISAEVILYHNIRIILYKLCRQNGILFIRYFC